MECANVWSTEMMTYELNCCWVQWFTSVILATHKAEIWRIAV
jgi:hypothetical protein